MQDDLFQELLTSVKQGAAIMNGDLQSARTFEFPETEVQLREQFGLSQGKFVHLVGVSVETLPNSKQRGHKPEGPT